MQKATLLTLVFSIFATTSGVEAMEEEALRKCVDPIQYAAVDISPSVKYISFIQREDEKNTLGQSSTLIKMIMQKSFGRQMRPLFILLWL